MKQIKICGRLRRLFFQRVAQQRYRQQSYPVCPSVVTKRRSCLFFSLGRCYMTFKGLTSVYPTGPNPKSFIINDLNGDTILDLAVANSDDNTITILLGNGNGTFHTPLIYSTGTGTNPSGITAGYFDSDTYIDQGKDAFIFKNASMKPSRFFRISRHFIDFYI